MSKNIHENMSGGQWVAALRKDSTLVSKCEWEKLSGNDWLALLEALPNEGEIVSKCNKWDKIAVDDVCDLLRRHPQLCGYCPDAVWLKFSLVHWAKLIREPGTTASASNTFVEKMEALGKTELIADWCCPFHWANEYGSVFLRFAAATPRKDRVCRIAEASAMNPFWTIDGRNTRYSSDILKHIQWLSSVAADCADAAAMAADPACPSLEHAEEYRLIAEAANYEINVLVKKST